MVRRWFSVLKPPKIVRSSRIGVEFLLFPVGGDMVMIHDLHGTVSYVVACNDVEMGLAYSFINHRLIRAHLALSTLCDGLPQSKGPKKPDNNVVRVAQCSSLGTLIEVET
jgi:hypothetical protein